MVELIETRGLELKGEAVALIVGEIDEKVRVTNTAQVRIEETLAAEVSAPPATCRGRSRPMPSNERSTPRGWILPASPSMAPPSLPRSTRWGRAGR